ncbi:MAG: tellurite resistance/C4-dicarboxylate transporter family protein [Candidatus Obscuribacterales bacterium]|nr:tellurite resistance/C4-dicarboxylate transporter family protein [Candidatus Obscuribacterales bacterium]
MKNTIYDEIEKLHPAYFALVMATGIVSVACQFLAMRAIAISMFVLNLVLFAILCLLTALRLFCYTKSFVFDLTDHNRCVGFFSIVAAICVLGSQFVVLFHDYPTAIIFWFLGTFFWLSLTYAIFTILTVKENKPSLAEGINGGWLLAVVATQAVSNLGGLVASSLKPFEQEILFFTLAMWLCGGMLYIWMISLIFYRYTFFKFLPSDLAPPYWINMGAVAITTLAGTRLITNADKSPLLSGLMPFLEGFTLFFWATATWWIPMLITLAVWRHIGKRFPLTYDPLYWGLVFPLGMYTAATFQLAQVTGLTFLMTIPRYFIYLALLAWSITFIGLLCRIVKKLTIFQH